MKKLVTILGLSTALCLSGCISLKMKLSEIRNEDQFLLYNDHETRSSYSDKSAYFSRLIINKNLKNFGNSFACGSFDDSFVIWHFEPYKDHHILKITLVDDNNNTKTIAYDWPFNIDWVFYPSNQIHDDIKYAHSLGGYRLKFKGTNVKSPISLPRMFSSDRRDVIIDTISSNFLREEWNVFYNYVAKSFNVPLYFDQNWPDR
ncbi:MAG: hypothetical protein NC405_05925 [Odoribacter sp.]|nr:hypothetical protein [Odoribacter sp.]